MMILGLCWQMCRIERLEIFDEFEEWNIMQVCTTNATSFVILTLTSAIISILGKLWDFQSYFSEGFGAFSYNPISTWK